jgi:transposase-like protein
MLKKLIFILVAIVITLALFSHLISPVQQNTNQLSAPPAPAFQSDRSPSIGDEAVLDMGGLAVWVAKTKADNSRLTQLCVAQDQLGIAEMLFDGRVMSVEVGTLVKVIDLGLFTTEIRILEGKHAGRSGFLPSEFVVSKNLREELRKKIDTHKKELADSIAQLDKIEETERLEKQKRQLEKEREIAKAKEEQRLKELELREKEIMDKILAEEKAKNKLKEENESKAHELLKHAKRWLNEEQNKEIAIRRLEELLRRFPDSSVAEEAKKMHNEISK